MFKKVFYCVVFLFLLIFIFDSQVFAQSSPLQQYCHDGIYFLNDVPCGRSPYCGGKSYEDVEGINWDTPTTSACWLTRTCTSGANVGEVPLCCYAIEQTGNPLFCTWPERGYCQQQQCEQIPSAERETGCGGGPCRCGSPLITHARDECGITNIPYLSLAQRLGTQATPTVPPSSTNTPIPTITPTPTILPNTPCTQSDNSSLNLSFKADHIKNLAVFNSEAELEIIGYNWSLNCYKINSNISVRNNTSSIIDEYVLNNPVNFPAGNYTIYIKSSRHTPRDFQQIILTADTSLDCSAENSQMSDNCGELKNTQIKENKIFYSGDIYRDGRIDVVDFELYRQKVGLSSNGNKADFDFNGQVEFKNGVDDDFAVLKRNFNKAGLISYNVSQ